MVASTPEKPLILSESEKNALAELVSIIRSVRYQMAIERKSAKPGITEPYLLEVGTQVLEVADRYFAVRPGNWDAVINQVNRLPPVQ